MKKDLTKKLFSRDSITLYIVAAIYILVSVMLFSGSLSRQITNMLIPVSCYIVLAVSLNLVEGLLVSFEERLHIGRHVLLGE